MNEVDTLTITDRVNMFIRNDFISNFSLDYWTIFIIIIFTKKFCFSVLLWSSVALFKFLLKRVWVLQLTDRRSLIITISIHSFASLSFRKLFWVILVDFEAFVCSTRVQAESFSKKNLVLQIWFKSLNRIALSL